MTRSRQHKRPDVDVPRFCLACKLPLDTLMRDEVRLSIHDVLVRCKECSHIIIYRSSGKPPLSEAEIINALIKKEPSK